MEDIPLKTRAGYLFYALRAELGIGRGNSYFVR